jgi:GAF domain-containing protein
MNLFAISGISCAISCTILSVIGLFFGKAKLHRLLIAFNMVVAVWGLGLFFVGIADTESEAILSWKLAHLGGFFVGPTFYHLVSVFCGSRRKTLLYLGYLQASIFATIGLGTELVFNKTRYVYGLYYNDITPLYVTGVSIYLFFVILSYFTLLKYFLRTQGFKHKQALYIILGFSFGFIGATSAFLPMFKIDTIYPFGNFGITIYCIITTYSILRHRLMDIHVVLKKSLVYSLSASFLSGIFVVLVLTMTKYLSDYMGITSFLITVISALVIAILFAPLKIKIQFLVDKLFYKSSYSCYSTVQKISRELASTIELRSTYKTIVDTIFETLKLKSTYLLFAGKEFFEVAYLRVAKDATACKDNGSTPSIVSGDMKNEFGKTAQLNLLNRDSGLVRLSIKETILIKGELQIVTDHQKAKNIAEEFTLYNGEVAVPILLEDELMFLLILGGKLSGDNFSAEDINMFKTIANQSAIALKNAKLYDELERRVEERTAELSKSNKNLHKEITERKRAEKKLHNIHRELEFRVEERTSDLIKVNQQLQLEVTERRIIEDALKNSREELKERVEDLEKFYDMAVNRELKMIELKKRIQSLQTKLSDYEVINYNMD